MLAEGRFRDTSFATSREVSPWAAADEVDEIVECAKSGNPAAQYMIGRALEMAGPSGFDDAQTWFAAAAEQVMYRHKSGSHLPDATICKNRQLGHSIK